MSLLYPDPGGRFDDREVLENAVEFTTGLRARSAFRLLDEPLEGYDDFERAAAALDAFQQWVMTTEDSLGWLFALQDWEPGRFDRGLFSLLDTIQVGRALWTELEAAALLERLTLTDFRERIARLPSDEDLASHGWGAERIRLVDIAVQAQIAGFTRMVERRTRGERSIVRAYNKTKNHLLAVPAFRDGRVEVGLLTAAQGASSYAEPEEGIEVTGAWISTDPETTRDRARGVIQMQAVLVSISVVILDVRYGLQPAQPKWAAEALDLPGWIEDPGTRVRPPPVTASR